MELKYSRSYSYILGAYVILILVALSVAPFGFDAAAFIFTAILTPLLIAFLLVSQIRSGIALDSHWVAVHRRGTWQFAVLIALELLGLLASFAFVISLAFPGIID